MKKFASILFLFNTLNLFGQTPAPLAIKPLKKYTLQIDAGVNFFRYSREQFTLWPRSTYSNPENTASHYEAITITSELNPTISFSLGIRNINYEYKSHFSAFDATTENVTSNNILQWNYRTIQTPIQIKIKPLTSKKLSFIAGGYLGYNYHNSESTLSSEIQIPHDNMKNKLDKGIILGMDYDWFKMGDLLIGNSLSYYRGYPYLHPFKYTRRSQGLTIGFTAKWGL